MVLTSAAAATNETALTMKAMSRPNTLATKPPSAAPMASIAPHSEPNNRLAFASSPSSLARFGSPACADGPTNDPSAEITQRKANPNQSDDAEETSSNPSAATACTMDTTRMIWRRSNRSAVGPAIADMRKAGSACAT
ncbi:MAG: hypothetical protein FD127_3126 [Acidimicrobiaceae bacterium]|nr:MAG: hypothetical protein FD127_3126 [Acidimicrobiaceae bacterium]